MTSRHFKAWIFYGVALAIVLADQLTKFWVRTHLQPGVPWDPLPWLRPVLSFTFVTNTGVVFGLFPGMSWLFTIVNIVEIVLIVYFYYSMFVQTWLVRVTMGLLLGGACGNLIDRLWRGWVTDFLDLNFWPMQEWAVFNIADSAVVVGTCVLMVLLLSQMNRQREGPPPWVS